MRARSSMTMKTASSSSKATMHVFTCMVSRLLQSLVCVRTSGGAFPIRTLLRDCNIHIRSRASMTVLPGESTAGNRAWFSQIFFINYHFSQLSLSKLSFDLTVLSVNYPGALMCRSLPDGGEEQERGHRALQGRQLPPGRRALHQGTGVPIYICIYVNICTYTYTYIYIHIYI